MIKTAIFDLGGVIATLSQDKAIERFKEIGVSQAERLLDPYEQTDIFGDLESGHITREQFVEALSQQCGVRLTDAQCQYGWMGYMKEIPQYRLDYILTLKEDGIHTILLSNTNPFVWEWASSEAFSAAQKPVQYYFNVCYTSFQLGMMKPDERIFRHIISTEQILPEETIFVDDGPRNCAAASQLGIQTYKPDNGEDWRKAVDKLIKF